VTDFKLDDVIDVQVTLASATPSFSPEVYARELFRHRPLDRQGRHAMQATLAELLLPELKGVAMRVLDSAGFRLPAMPESTRRIESALVARLHELGVTDVFTVDVSLVDTFERPGVLDQVSIRLGPTAEELEQFGFFKSESEQQT
jgi:hypothetical protein